MSISISLSSLAEEFQETKKRLREVEDGLQKHSGRPNNQQQRFKFRPDVPPNLRANLAQRLDDDKRQHGGAFSRLGRQLNPQEAQRMGNNHLGPSGPKMARSDQRRQSNVRPGAKEVEPEEKVEDEEEEEIVKKPSLLSSIGASSINVKGKSRSELLNEQKSDKKVIARNRRMFGVMLGTLKSFEKEETTKRKEQVAKKVEKEQKVEEMKEKEREENKRQHRELVNERREKKVQLKRLHSKMEVVGAFEEFSKRHKYMSHFIHTIGKPPIMWLPKNHTSETEKLLEKSKLKIEAIIAKEEERVKLEIERIEGVSRDSDGDAEEKENSTIQSSITVVSKKDSEQQEKTQNGDGGSEMQTDEPLKANEKTAMPEQSPDPPTELKSDEIQKEQVLVKEEPPSSDSSSEGESPSKKRKRKDSTSTTSSSSDDERKPRMKASQIVRRNEKDSDRRMKSRQSPTGRKLSPRRQSPTGRRSPRRKSPNGGSPKRRRRSRSPRPRRSRSPRRRR